MKRQLQYQIVKRLKGLDVDMENSLDIQQDTTPCCCDPPEPVGNSDFSNPGPYAEDTKVTYNCYSGYDLLPTGFHRTCILMNDTLQWIDSTNENPYCKYALTNNVSYMPEWLQILLSVVLVLLLLILLILVIFVFWYLCCRRCCKCLCVCCQGNSSQVYDNENDVGNDKPINSQYVYVHGFEQRHLSAGQQEGNTKYILVETPNTTDSNKMEKKDDTPQKIVVKEVGVQAKEEKEKGNRNATKSQISSQDTFELSQRNAVEQPPWMPHTHSVRGDHSHSKSITK